MMLMLVFSIAFQHAFDNRTDLSELRGRPHRYRQPYFWLEKIVLINGRQPEIVQGIIERVFCVPRRHQDASSIFVVLKHQFDFNFVKNVVNALAVASPNARRGATALDCIFRNIGQSSGIGVASITRKKEAEPLGLFERDRLPLGK